MKAKDLKVALHETIENINDTELLKTLTEITSHHYSVVEEPELENYQLDRLKESQKQIKEGKYYSNEQANDLIQKWLSK